MKRLSLPASLIAAAYLACAAAGAGAQALTLRVASYVPPNSTWDIGLKKLAADFDRISGGRVKLVFPQSLRASSDSDIIQKMKFGVDGALITTMGVAELYPDSLALAIPSIIRSDEEYDAVLAVVEPLIRKKLADRYVVLALAKGGWIRYFSKSPIVYPEDLVKARMAVSADDDKIQRLLQSVGTRTVKADMAALILQLSSNTVDAFYLSPVQLASLWTQYKSQVSYMSPFKVSPFLGAVIFTKQSWDKVPAEFRPRLEEATREAARVMARESAKLEEDAIAAMVREGLKVPAYPADAEPKWNALYAEKRDSLVATMFSADFLEAMRKALASARSKR
ncbi:MAG TPA: TRAP transporter substrate-binding protein DctP [Spirochaetia bacterium]|nr:TRAP transporter substrate-binding protein DctP [Spirochaetia bacterium]